MFNNFHGKMTTLEQLFIRAKAAVDEALDRLIPKPSVDPRKLHEAIRWSVFAGGKRIRPAVLMAVGETFGAHDEQLVEVAAAFEMIHTYSLIHDDLPSMDNDDLRRGKATCHIKYGEATAILAGDVLQTLAFRAIANDASLEPEMAIRLVFLLADAAGTPRGMVSGQQLDIDGQGEPLAVEEIERIHAQKTGALITAAAVSGALIGGASESEIAAIRQYAEKLGLLFQITDDLLDVTAATEAIGKTAGKDAVMQKATYASFFGIEGGQHMATAVRDEAVRVLKTLDRDTSLLRELADVIRARSA